LEKQQDRLIEEAKAKMQKKDKKGAMYCLKKKKMVQGQVDTIMGTMITLEQQKMALENAATCVQCFPACSLYVGNMWAYARSCGIVIRGFSTRAEGPPSLLGVSLGCLRAPGVPRAPHAVGLACIGTRLSFGLRRNRLAVDAIQGGNAAISTAMGGYDVEKVRTTSRAA
jgi:hypothetical protein